MHTGEIEKNQPPISLVAPCVQNPSCWAVGRLQTSASRHPGLSALHPANTSRILRTQYRCILTRSGHGAMNVEHLTRVRWFAIVFARLGNKLQRLPLCMRSARLRLNHPRRALWGCHAGCMQIYIYRLHPHTHLDIFFISDLHSLLAIVAHSYQVVLETISNHDDGREERGRRPSCIVHRVSYSRTLLIPSRRSRLMKLRKNTSRPLLAVLPLMMH